MKVEVQFGRRNIQQWQVLILSVVCYEFLTWSQTSTKDSVSFLPFANMWPLLHELSVCVCVCVWGGGGGQCERMFLPHNQIHIHVPTMKAHQLLCVLWTVL